MAPDTPDSRQADDLDPTPPDADPDRVVQALRALGHPLRYRIAQVLARCEDAESDDACGACRVVCATRLRLRFGVSAPDLTHHMTVLHEAGLVDVHRDGVWVRYELRDPSFPWLASVLTGPAPEGGRAGRPPLDAPGT